MLVAIALTPVSAAVLGICMPRIRHCVECPNCRTRYLIAFTPYSNGAYLIPTAEDSKEEYTLYCLLQLRKRFGKEPLEVARSEGLRGIHSGLRSRLRHRGRDIPGSSGAESRLGLGSLAIHYELAINGEEEGFLVSQDFDQRAGKGPLHRCNANEISFK